MLEFPILIIATFIAASVSIIICSSSLPSSKTIKLQSNEITAFQKFSRIIITFSFSMLSTVLLSKYLIATSSSI
jgi:hypothetical protein